MKKTLRNILLLSLFGMGVKATAQPTLTAAGCNPTLGYTTNAAYNSGFAQGASGANQTWNFATIANTSTANSQYVTVASTPNASQFPNSNLAAFGGGAYSYYNISNSAYTLNGVVAPTSGTVISYSNGEDLLRFPFTFGNSYTDNWAATFTSGVNFYRSGSTTVTADGYGTLITPNGTYSNVLRVHFVQTYHDSTDFGGYDYVNDEYIWYKEGIKESLALTYTFSTTFSGQTTTSTSGAYATGTVGMEESSPALAFVLAPNPAQDKINITLNDINLSQIKTRIINQLGQEVSSAEHVNYLSGNTMQFDVAHLRNGIYQLQLINENGTIETRKFMVSH